jgi:hypothetical protein
MLSTMGETVEAVSSYLLLETITRLLIIPLQTLKLLLLEQVHPATQGNVRQAILLK